MYDVERALKGVQKALLNQNIQNSKSSKQKLTRRLPNNILRGIQKLSESEIYSEQHGNKDGVRLKGIKSCG